MERYRLRAALNRRVLRIVA